MKDKRTDSIERLKHIKKSIISIEGFVKEKRETDFLNDELLQSAILFQFSIIGEAIVHIDDNILEGYDYPWYRLLDISHFKKN